MGTPADPDEPDYDDGDPGDDGGETIFNGHTPLYVKFTVEGVEPCPPIPGLPASFGNGILKQKAIDAGFWWVSFNRGGDIQDYSWRVNVGGAFESDCTYTLEGVPIFSGEDAAEYVAAFDNLLNCGDGDVVFDGTVGITWGPDINQEAYDAQF